MTASPSDSFYAMSDDDEGEYNTVRHTKTGKGVKLLFTKSKVYIHPTPAARDNMPGFIALIQQKSAPGALSADDDDATTADTGSVAAHKLLLAWVPEATLGEAFDAYVKVDLLDSASPPKTTVLVPAPPIAATHGASAGLGPYAFAVPVASVYSLLVRPPCIGWWYGSVVINTRAGDSFPPLFFHDDECQSTVLQRKRLARESFDPFQGGAGMFWGGDEVLRWLKRYVPVEKAGADPNIFLIEPSPEDRKGFSRLDFEKKKDEPKDKSPARPSRSRDGAMDPITKLLKEAKWNVLEKLSQVTTFTRRTAQAVAENPKMPPQIRNLMRNPEVQTISEEFDSARIYLARWAMQMAEQSERERNKRVWSAKDVLEMENTGVGDFEILEMDVGKMGLTERRKPVTQEEWDGFFDPVTGRLHITADEVKEKIFHGGLDEHDGVRKEAWLFLLGAFKWDSTKEDRQRITLDMRDKYMRLKGQWWERLADGIGTEEQQEWWREQRNRIEKDVHRTDRNLPLFAGEDCPHPDPNSPFAEVGTNVHLEQMKEILLTYNEWNKDLGYVQGMSDLLAPIYAVMQDDAIAFLGFIHFMERMERNFLRDQSGMRLQLQTLDHLVQLLDPPLYAHLQAADATNFFFFFRMLLVWYKREFEWANVLRLWEVLWTDYLSADFHLFVALAILERHRTVIIDHLQHFDEILKYVNELSNTIDLHTTLVQAEALFRRFHRTVEAIDRKHAFPPPSGAQLRQRKPDAQGTAKIDATDAARVAVAVDAAAPGTATAVVASSSGNDARGDDALDGATAVQAGEEEQGGGAAAGPSPAAKGKGPALPDVVSPELRALLNRERPKTAAVAEMVAGKAGQSDGDAV